MLPTFCLIRPALSMSRSCRSCSNRCFSACDGSAGALDAWRREAGGSDELDATGANARRVVCRSWDETSEASGRGRLCIVGSGVGGGSGRRQR